MCRRTIRLQARPGSHVGLQSALLAPACLSRAVRTLPRLRCGGGGGGAGANNPVDNRRGLRSNPPHAVTLGAHSRIGDLRGNLARPARPCRRTPPPFARAPEPSAGAPEPSIGTNGPSVGANERSVKPSDHPWAPTDRRGRQRTVRGCQRTIRGCQRTIRGTSGPPVGANGPSGGARKPFNRDLAVRGHPVKKPVRTNKKLINTQERP